ncbi:hypothetical protein [Pseudomonas sp. TWRC1-2]|uniref:hypothetical protein n=1 Tax=Pseudomonas sp. TWRC1-2 TaxID=2804628 RepID=UPI003CF02C49
MSISLVVCERCGGGLVSFEENSAKGLRCSVCDWSLVTTNISGIKVDEEIYEVFCAGDYRNKSHIKAVSEVFGSNFLKSRDLLQQGMFRIFSGKAVDVLRVRKILAEVGVEYIIKPDFIWV